VLPYLIERSSTTTAGAASSGGVERGRDTPGF